MLRILAMTPPKHRLPQLSIKLLKVHLNYNHIETYRNVVIINVPLNLSSCTRNSLVIVSSQLFSLSVLLPNRASASSMSNISSGVLLENTSLIFFSDSPIFFDIMLLPDRVISLLLHTLAI